MRKLLYHLFGFIAFLGLMSPNALQAQCGNFNVTAQDSALNPCDTNRFVVSNIMAGTAPFTFQWSNGQTGMSTQRNLSTYYNSTAGSGWLIVQDSMGCRDTATFTIFRGNPVVSLVSSTQPSCGQSNGTLGIIASGGATPYSYLWSNGNTSSFATGLAAGTYSLTVTTANGCRAINSYVLSNSNNIGITADTVRNPTCGASNGNITYRATGGTAPYTYRWSNGQTGTTSATTSLNNLAPGTYGITMTSANGCVGSTSRTLVNVSGINASFFSVTNPSCGLSNGTIGIQAAGGTSPYTFAWTGGRTGSFLTGLAAGTYFVTVTDATGCSGLFNRSISNTTTTGTVSFVSVVNPSCTGGFTNGSITAQRTGGTAPYTFAWTGGRTGNTITGLSAGTYSVTATDATGCAAVNSYALNNSTVNTLSISIVDSAQACDSLHNLSAYVSGGTAPYTFAWSNGFTGQYNNPFVGAGTVYVTVSSQSGCAGYASRTITTGSLAVTTTSVVNPSCGQANGTIAAYASGGTAPYTYLWSNGSTTSYISNLPVGNYSVTISSANGCTGSTSRSLQNANNIQASIADSSVACDSMRRLTANVFGGTAPYTFVWSNGGSNQSNNNYLTGQTAIVTITSANGCTTVVSRMLSPVYSQLTYANVQQTQCTASTGSVSVAGGAGWQYRWSTGATTAISSGLNTSSSIQNLSVGTYSLTVTTQNGCQFVRQFYVGMSQNCQALISGYAYRVAQGGACQPNNTPCELCLIRVYNGVSYQYVQTDRNGFYSYRTSRISTHQVVFSGTRTGNSYSVVCPTGNNISVSVASLTSTYPNNNFYVNVTPRLDLSLSQGSNFPSPNAFHYQYGNICNAGDSPANGTYVFNYDSRLTYQNAYFSQSGSVSATISAVANNPSTHSLTVTFSNLAPYNCFSFQLNFRTDTTVTIGDTLCGNALVTMTNGTETNLTNNVVSRCLPVRASYDPNDKQVLNHTSGGTYEGGISPSQTELKYQIRFQNTGTAPAQRVIVRDVLTADLLPSSISNIAMSHAGTFNIYDNELVVEFNNINLEPQSVSEELSQGFISFSIERNPNLAVGAHIDNSASIFFDYNSPIITNTARTTIMQMVAVAETCAAEMSLKVMPNPFNEQLQVAYELETDSKVRVSLLNTLGETVMQVANSNQNAGNQQLSISTQDLGAGVYYLLIETEAGRFAQKVIKQ